MDKERVINNERSLPIQLLWESKYLKQTITYNYNEDDELVEESVIQIDKITNATKTIYCKYYDVYCTIVVTDGNDMEVIECGYVR